MKTIAISKTLRLRGMADGGVKISRLTSATRGRLPQVIWLSKRERDALLRDLAAHSEREQP